MMADHIEFLGQIKNKISNQYNGKILYLMVSGSHAFGFNSPDSDIDYRGCFQVSTNKLLGLKRPKDFMEWKILKEGMTVADVYERDIYDKEVVLDELQKEVGLLMAGNCNHWEHLMGKPLLTSPEHKELKDIMLDQMNFNGIYHSYRGMAYQNYKKFILGGKHTVKKYLYVLRGLMAGFYAITEKRIEPNIQVLAEKYNRPIVDELVDLKQRGMEKDPVNKNLDRYNKEVDHWFVELDEMADTVVLPEQKQINENDNILSEWMLKTRLNYLDGYK